jgi:hypothetical protein
MQLNAFYNQLIRAAPLYTNFNFFVKKYQNNTIIEPEIEDKV